MTNAELMMELLKLDPDEPTQMSFVWEPPGGVRRRFWGPVRSAS